MTESKPQPRIHDFRKPSWGRVCELWTRDDDGTVLARGYGGGLREGDVVALYAKHGDHFLIKGDKLPDQEALVMYRLTEKIRWDGRGSPPPRDAFEFKAVPDETLFELVDGKFVYQGDDAGDSKALTQTEQVALDLVNASGGVQAARGTEMAYALEQLSERGLVRLEGDRYFKAEGASQ